LSIEGLVAHDKVYDGSLEMAVTGTPVITGGVIGADEVTVGGAPVGTASSKDVGTVNVSVSGLDLIERMADFLG
jgi:hypothetical protein